MEAAGFTVHGCRDGAAGLAQAVGGEYDLVVLDLLLPRLDGLSVLREVRAQRPALPVVVLSARSDIPTKLRGFALGANDYVAKPFSLAELIARIRAQLRRVAGAEEGTVLHAGPLDLDVARREARIGGAVCALSDREFRVLWVLAQHPGEIVSRESLLSDVWGYHFHPGSNVVDVCVRRLRQKLGPAAPIETVRHAGYRLAGA
jgi:DNA-binding response OmpR family regulator